MITEKHKRIGLEKDITLVAQALPTQLIHPRILADAVEEELREQEQYKENEKETKIGQGAAEGLFARTAYVGDKSARNRARYNKEVAKLSPEDTKGRKRIKEATRRRDPIEVRKKIKKDRPGLGPKAGSGGTANRTNEEVNKQAKRFGRFGRGVAGLGVLLALYDIYRSEEKARAAAGNVGAVLGGIFGGAGGGLIGSPAGPVGAVAGSVAGATALGEAGYHGGTALYDYWFGDESSKTKKR